MLPHRQVVQAQALLWAADGVANEEIARRSRVGSDTVRRWRKRFTDKGVDGVGGIAKGRGRKSWLPPGTVQRVVGLTLTGEPPGGATHWTTRTLAAQVGVGKDTVAQIWADHRLQPWRVDASRPGAAGGQVGGVGEVGAVTGLGDLAGQADREHVLTHSGRYHPVELTV